MHRKVPQGDAFGRRWRHGTRRRSGVGEAGRPADQAASVVSDRHGPVATVAADAGSSAGNVVSRG